MLTNFSASLALIAGIASASYGHSHGYASRPQYQSYQPPQYAPRPQPSQSQQQHHSGPSHQHAYGNAWGQQRLNTQDTTGWWSPYQQYRPAVIAYEPAPIYEPVFAICETMTQISASGVGGYIRFAQTKGHPVQAQASLTGLSGTDDYWFKIGETGILGEDCAAAIDDEEFNPMYAIDKYGNAFTYQDPWRGRIQQCVAPSATLEFIQAHFYAQLSGKDSIIGRSITMIKSPITTLNDESDDTPVGCCVIARDEKPEDRPKTNVHHAYPVPNPQPQHHQQVNQYAPRPAPQAAPKPVSHYHQPEPVAAPKPVSHYHQPEPVAAPKPVSHYRQPEPVAVPKPEPVSQPEPVRQQSHYSHYQPRPAPINHYPVSHYQQPRSRPVARPLPTYNAYRPQHQASHGAGRNGFSNQYQQYPYAW